MLYKFFSKLRQIKMLKDQLMDTKMLNQHLNDEQAKHALRILDCTYYLANVNQNAKEEFEKERIPGSIFWDFEEIRDKNNKLPNTLITDEKEFIEHMKR